MTTYITDKETWEMRLVTMTNANGIDYTADFINSFANELFQVNDMDELPITAPESVADEAYSATIFVAETAEDADWWAAFCGLNEAVQGALAEANGEELDAMMDDLNAYCVFDDPTMAGTRALAMLEKCEWPNADSIREAAKAFQKVE